MTSPLSLAEYYGDPHVRARMAEYCGVTREAGASAVFLAGMRAGDTPFATWDRAPRYPVERLDSLLESGADIARSMWDRDDLLLFLDFDYVNIDAPGEAYLHPADVFHKLEPTYRAALHVFARHGLTLLSVVTGRGYHFTGRIPLNAPVVDRLAELSPQAPSWFRTMEQRRPSWPAPAMSERQARAWGGVGLLVEFLAHQILRRARPRSPLPIVLNNTVVGTGDVGRECVSIDLSYAGDPLDVRHVRVAFGAYQKHCFKTELGRAASRPPMAAVPRVHEAIEHMLVDRSNLRHAARLARSASAVLPDTSRGVDRLVGAYARSSLARFHRAFAAAVPARRQMPAARRMPAVRAQLPSCVARPLAVPNDLLLQPAVIQHVTRVLLAEGLTPRDIAALIQGRYEADCGWGTRWSWMDAETRALFEVRVFSGMLLTGLDEAIDLNCRSTQEKGLCPGVPCDRDLRGSRAQLLEAVRS